MVGKGWIEVSGAQFLGKNMILVALVLALLSSQCGADTVRINKVVDRVYLGIGGLSGGGATSRLLPAYSAEKRSEIFDYLFKPNFGASFQIIKVEIGGDGQSTQGSEASHLHTPDDLSCDRGYEWMVLQEAKKRAPDIKTYGLSWAWPGWVDPSGDHSSPWNSITTAANYTMAWLNCAKEKGIKIDYIGSWNERPYSSDYLKLLRKELDSNGFEDTLINAPDSNWDIAGDMLSDPQLNASVYAPSAHYPGQFSSADAKATKHPLLASEDDSTYGGGGVGSACWGRILNRNYVLGAMSGSIMWNLLDSCLAHLPWYGAATGVAHSPWSGNYHFFPALWLTAHTTQFTAANGMWHYLANSTNSSVPGGSGMLPSGGSYVTLVDTGGSNDFTIIVENFHHDRSACIRPSNAPYQSQAHNVTFVLQGVGTVGQTLAVWRSKIGYNADESSLFQQMPSVTLGTDRTITVELDLDSMYTISSITSGPSKGSHPTPPPPTPFPVPYSDNFDSCAIASQVNYFTDQSGSFECVSAEVVGREGIVLRQMSLEHPISWGGDVVPLSVYGAASWTDQSHQVDVWTNTTAFPAIGARITGTTHAQGVWLVVGTSGMWWVYCNTGDFPTTSKAIDSGSINFPSSSWATLGLEIKGGMATGSFNGTTLFSNKDYATTCNAAYGFGGLAVSTYDVAFFDNWKTTDATDPGTICGTMPSVGANVEMQRCESTRFNGMVWDLKDDTLVLRSTPSLCLGVSGKDPNSGYPNVATVDCSDALHFEFHADATNTSIVDKASGMCLDITSQGFTGANLELYPCNGGSNQHFVYGPEEGVLINTRDQPKDCACVCGN